VAAAYYPSKFVTMGIIAAVPFHKRLVTGLSPWYAGFAPGSVHVGFVVDKVALGQVFLQVLRFSSVSIIPPPFSILIYIFGG
jgi:hypothetical protein